MPKELTIWLSEVGDYENFEEGVKDADSFSLVIPSTNELAWVDSIESLIVGTFGDEWTIGSNNLETPLTPTNFTVKSQSAYGCLDIQPLDGGEALLFVDSVGRKAREMVYRDTESKYVSPDLTALAEHITLSGIVNWAIQYAPDQIVWCVLDDGSLIAMVYEREQDVVGWAKMPIDGFVQSVCVGGAGGEDAVYISIVRNETVTHASTVNNVTGDPEILTYEGETVTYGLVYIEKMMPRVFGDDITDAFFVDCGLTIENNPASATISDLDHLVGKTVTVLGDGVVYTPTDVVDENGEITISAAVSKAQVGLPFTYKLMPMRPDISTGEGTTHSSLVKVPEMGISFLNTMNAKYGVLDDKLYPVDWTNVRWVNNAEIDGLFTGDVVVAVDGGFTLDNNLIISGSDPLPCTVRALIPKMEQTGR
jgi:hypothetical protein